MQKLLPFLKKNAMILVLVLVYVFFLIASGGSMFDPMVFNQIITENAYVFILATGMLMCMLTGGNIDLSCGSFVCFLGAVGGVMMVNLEMSTGMSILMMLVIGIAYGCLLGYLIAYVNIPPWIATLAGYLAFRGLGTEILSASSVTSSISVPKNFINIFAGKLFATPFGTLNIPCLIAGVIACVIIAVVNFMTRANRIKNGYEADSMKTTIAKTVVADAVVALYAYKLAMAGGIPTVLLWVIGIVLVYSFITAKTNVGRYFYTIGGNREATRLSGVDTKLIMFLAYLNMAVLTVVTTYVVVARTQSANAFIGTNFEMDAIAACVVGGVSAYGGSGRIFGMVIGATLIGVINKGMTVMSIDANWQKVIKGVVILGAVVFDIIASKKNQNK